MWAVFVLFLTLPMSAATAFFACAHASHRSYDELGRIRFAVVADAERSNSAYGEIEGKVCLAGLWHCVRTLWI